MDIITVYTSPGLWQALKNSSRTQNRTWHREHTLGFYFILFHFMPCPAMPHTACGILVPYPGIEPMPPALEARSLNHWTTGEVPSILWCYIYAPPSKYSYYLVLPFSCTASNVPKDPIYDNDSALLITYCVPSTVPPCGESKEQQTGPHSGAAHRSVRERDPNTNNRTGLVIRTVVA